MDITQLLAFCVKNKGSDLHLSAGMPPMLRIAGDVRRLSVKPLTSEQISGVLVDLMTDAQRKAMRQRPNATFIHEIPGLARFRVAQFEHYRGVGATFRVVPNRILTLAQIGAPKVLHDVCRRPSGLVVISGRNGSGRTTTLAAMVEEVNTTEYAHVYTVEDSIEFLYESKLSLVTQREVGVHADSRASAVQSAIDADADVIVITDLQDADTTRLALLAAEKGHLVLAALDTRSAISTVERLVGMLATQDKELMRNLLSDSLVAVISQWLPRLKDSSGRVAAHEILVKTPATRSLIRQDRVDDLYSIMEAGEAFGMTTLDYSLQRLIRSGLISVDEAKRFAKYPEYFSKDRPRAEVRQRDKPLFGLLVRPGVAMPGQYY